MSEENKAIVQRFFEEIWNGGNLEVANEIIDSMYGQTDLTTGFQRIRGPEILVHEVEAYRSVTDDPRFNVRELIAEGDRVVALWEATAIPRGADPQTTGPSGGRGVSLHRIVDGKIVDIELYTLAFASDAVWLPGIQLS